MAEHKNSDIHLRPKFSIDFNESQEDLISKFKEAVNCKNCKFKSKIIDNHIIIDVPKEEDHFWSPQLHLEVLEIEKEESILKGLFGPKSQIWTFFMFVHFALAIAFVSFLIMIYTRQILDKNTTFPVVMTVLIIIMWIAMYFIGREGKKKGKPQMNELFSFMKGIIEK